MPLANDSKPQTVRVGIAGTSGYTGVELLRILHGHSRVQLTDLSAGSQAGRPISEIWPGLVGLYDGPALETDPDRIAERCDVVFLGLPHGLSARVGAALVGRGLRVFDLGADYRFRDPADYEATYGQKHPHPELCAEAVYGLPELHGRAEILREARLVACAGCYPTATILAALPLVEAGLVDWLSSSCLSGISGAGRSPGPRNLYCEVQESAEPYQVAGRHRHSPEIEQALGVPVSFTPHLVPMRRGMLATVTARLLRPISQDELRKHYLERYEKSPLISLRAEPPATRDVRGTARAHLHVALDERRRVVTAIAAIDNLGKGAAAQAVQCMNLALGFAETEGLPLLPLLP